MKKNSEILINFADKFLFSDPNKILMSYNYIINDGAHSDTTEPKNKVEYYGQPIFAVAAFLAGAGDNLFNPLSLILCSLGIVFLRRNSTLRRETM